MNDEGEQNFEQFRVLFFHAYDSAMGDRLVFIQYIVLHVINRTGMVRHFYGLLCLQRDERVFHSG